MEKHSRFCSPLYGSFAAWFLSVRFKPLILGVGPVFVGICLSFSQWNTFPWLLNGIIVFCVLCIQIATHFFNDALDFLKGADTATRKGPKRAVQQKMITPNKLMRAGYLCLSLAALAGIYLVLQGGGGWPVFYVGILSLALTYLYTGGPYPLAYTGLADLFVLLFFGLIPSATVFYLNTGYWDTGSFVVGLQCGLLALSLLLVNNLRDVKEDRSVGKKTLVVRFGPYFGMCEWTLAHYLPYLLGIYWFFKHSSFIVFLPLILLPFSIYIHCILLKAFKKEYLYGRVLILTCLYYLLFVFLCCLVYMLFL